VALGVLTIVAPSCDLNDLDEIQNSSNQAVVRAQFFASRTNQVPVPGVRMVIESDDDSDRPYRGPDVIGVSGDDGVATALVFPGFEDERDQNNNTGGNEQPTGPEDPLDLPPPLFFGDVAVTLIYQGSIVSFISGGLTLGSGRLFDLGPIFLDELQVVVN
jgi:hypothetical protein